MLKGTVGTPSNIKVNGFLIAIELEEGIDVDAVMNRLADAVSFMDGTGQVEVNHLGELELVPEDHPDAMMIFQGDGEHTEIKES